MSSPNIVKGKATEYEVEYCHHTSVYQSAMDYNPRGLAEGHLDYDPGLSDFMIVDSQ